MMDYFAFEKSLLNGQVKYREVEQEAVGRGKQCDDVASELVQGKDGNEWVCVYSHSTLERIVF